MEKAKLLVESKDTDPASGNITEIIIWDVPQPVPPSAHGFKYRLVYVEHGRRIIGFDNERGKGDHYHLYGREYGYNFTNIGTLLADFFAAIERHNSNENFND